MTFGSVFRGAVEHTTSHYYDHYPPTGLTGESGPYAAERDATAAAAAWPTKTYKGKWKTKSDKKQAVLSALTLLAFLFFLNILQNCLREHTDNSNPTLMMMVPGMPGQAQASQRDPTEEDQTLQQIHQHRDEARHKRNAQEDEILGQVEKEIWSEKAGKSRRLLQYNDENNIQNRQTKFIHNYKEVNNNWADELTQVSDKDLETQKLKMDSLRLFWKDNRLVGLTTTERSERLKIETLPSIKINKLIKSPILSDSVDFPMKRRIKKKNKIITTTLLPEDIKSMDFETVEKKVADFEDFVGNSKEENSTEEPTTVSYFSNNLIENEPEKPVKEYLRSKLKFKNKYSSTPENFHLDGEVVTTHYPNLKEFIGDVGTPEVYQAQNSVVNTPRNRRSDYTSSTRPSEESQESQETSKPVDVEKTSTPSVGLDLNSFETYHVYSHPSQKYYNHRYTAQPYMENNTADVATPAPTTNPPTTQTNRPEDVKITTATPSYYPVHPLKLNPKPNYDKLKHHRLTGRYPNNFGYYPQQKHRYWDSRYKYSPYRKTSPYEPYLHDEYYPMSVVGKYPAPSEDEMGFNLIRFVWTMLTTFAKPLARLVPSFAKVGQAEAQCYDLLVCEANRFSRYVGPTAEAVASTLSTVLTWVSSDEYRQPFIDAINAGKENTCQRQIQDCDERSGGKSAMTMIAQVIETKISRR